MKPMTRFIIWSGIALSLLIGFSFLGYAPTSNAAFGGSNGLIAFESTEAGNAEVFAMNPDGTGVTNISQSPEYEGEPVWSPDGTKIVFISLRDGNSEIYSMNADGTAQTRLTTDPAVDELPSWSPDGTKIIFYSQRDGNDQIYIMNADGTNQTNISNNTDNDEFPRFSPDGSKILFQSNGGYMFLMNPDGTNRLQLTSSGGYSSPAWSPDGTKIAISGGGAFIAVVNADGTNQTIIANSGSDSSPAWSPDGTKIAFDSQRDGDYEIYVMNPDGTNQTRLTNNPAVDFRPDWQPIGNVPLPTPLPAQMRVATGSYVGNGTDNRSITGIGFAPDAVFIKGNVGQPAIVRLATMSAGVSKTLNGGGAVTNRIKSLNSDGFTIGTDADVNNSSPAKTYYWIAFKAAAGELKLGTYTGNHSGQTISGVGFQPSYVFVIASGTGQGWQRSSATSGVKSYNYGNADSNTAITALAADGFTVGNDDQVNENGKTFYYLAWKQHAGTMSTGTYSGNSTDNRDIIAVGFRPDWVIIKNTGGTSELVVQRPLALGASNDDTMEFNADNNLGSGYIKALISQGFRLGTKPQVNGGTQCSGACTYFWVGFKDSGN